MDDEERERRREADDEAKEREKGTDVACDEDGQLTDVHQNIHQEQITGIQTDDELSPADATHSIGVQNGFNQEQETGEQEDADDVETSKIDGGEDVEVADNRETLDERGHVHSQTGPKSDHTLLQRDSETDSVLQ